MHPNLTAGVRASNGDRSHGVLLADQCHSYGQVHALNGLTLKLASGDHDALSFTVGSRVVIVPGRDIAVVGNSNEALEEEDAA